MPADEVGNCIFCRIVQGEADSELLYADDEIVSFNDIQPQAPVHFLVIPRRHVASVSDLSDSEMLCGRLLATAARIAHQQGLGEDGYRIAINNGRDGRQSVEHLHVHVLGGRPLRGSMG